jgi:peptidoglycan hydrolase-like protein with peptidoglycan-binding domain
VPAYRDLGPGESGTDVRQLQAMLSDLGLLSRKPTGRFDAATERAVSTWHKMLGAGNSARVAFGEIIFVPTHLPARLSLDASVVHRDARLGGGEPVLSTLPDEPRFTMTVTALQSGMIPDGTGVVITSPRGHTWAATVSGRGPQDGGDGVVLTLTGRDGAPIAGDQADELPVAGDTLLAARVQIVPATDGLVVPAAALATRGDGTTVVTLADGRVQPVAVTATAQGMAVITGVPERTKVRISGGQGS